ncbi:peptidase domain-containing ABC transporter [Achromobacter xylosoxidans]|uniref:peptidase domain-containing ABC transporter n=1 Tax=Achromobacter anxifer TaxID=1287737 RepID=UPI00155C9FE8|nr:peptidase domain-containing ABC transporter [Achromobacter anxifer]CAB5514635.1 Vitamin B12 import ATP-binding protein BtuD [Achromobacter anxifer]
MKFLKSLLSRDGAAPAAPVVDISLAHAQWICAALAQICRLPLREPTSPGGTTDSIPAADLLEQLADQGLTAAAREAKLLGDSAFTPSDAISVSLGPRPAIVLGRKEGQLLVLEPGAPAPQMHPVEAFLACRPGQPCVGLTREDPRFRDTTEGFGWVWFLRAFFSRKTVIRDVLIASLVIQLIALGYPLATQAIVDKVITNQAQSTLIALGIGIGLFAIFNALMSWVRQKLLLRLANVVDAELSTRVMRHLFRLPLRYFESRATGLLITRVKTVERVREFASGAFLLIALELPFMLIFLGLMLSYSGVLSGIVLGFVAVMVILSLACGPVLRAKANKQFEAGAKVQSYLTERVAAHETVKSLQLEGESVARFAELNRKELDASLDMAEFGSGYGTFMQLAEQLMNAAVLCAGAYLAMTSTSLTIGMLVAFQMFAQRVSQPLIRLSGTWQQLQQIRTGVAQLGEVMNTATERYGSAPTSAGKVNGALEVTGLGFRHAPDRPPLYADLAFQLKPGQVVLVTGPSGSGKSTLAKVMLGLYTGYEGFVRLDGRDIRTMPVNELRSHFGVVPQETVLFAGTILENVMGGAVATLEQAVQACKMAGVHQVIENLPEGYQTVVGERGSGLSGGQRQRIGIARALLKRPAVLIFDEATSGLDEASAEHIGQTVNYLRGKVTVLFVAHKVPASLTVDQHVRLGDKAA